MNAMTACPREDDLLAALNSHNWTDDLRQHAAGCPHCQETMAMTNLLQQIPDADHPLPSYRLLWLKAQYMRKEERISVMDVVALAGMSFVGVIALAGLMFWRFPELLGKIAGLPAPSASSWTNIVSSSSPFVVVLGAILLVWLLARDSFFAER